ncbi:MAG: cation:proton antiporter [Aliihoeflea sp.]
MMLIVSLLFKLAGVAFLCIAALGVMKLSDPFQRMHAATKAGTLGAGLVIIGSVMAQGALDATVLGILTVIFLLLTVPVAGHLLGRAAYVSGARLALAGDDALDGVLQRSAQPLDERIGWIPAEPDQQASGLRPENARGSLQTPERRTLEGRAQVLPAMEAVRFVVIDGYVRPVAERACALAAASGASLSAHVLIDTHAIAHAADPNQMRRSIRERASAALHDLKGCTSQAEVEPILNYDEGDPERLLRCETEAGETLLVLPCEGWFHHQVDARQDLTSWQPDGLLRLPGCHRGPVLFVANETPRESARTLVVHDGGESHLPALTEWALLNGLWDVATLVHVTEGGEGPSELAEIAARFGCAYVRRQSAGGESVVPSDIADVRAVVLGKTPRPLRTNWFGSHWRNRIMPGMAGDVLIMEKEQTGSSAKGLAGRS